MPEGVGPATGVGHWRKRLDRWSCPSRDPRLYAATVVFLSFLMCESYHSLRCSLSRQFEWSTGSGDDWQGSLFYGYMYQFCFILYRCAVVCWCCFLLRHMASLHFSSRFWVDSWSCNLELLAPSTECPAPGLHQGVQAFWLAYLRLSNSQGFMGYNCYSILYSYNTKNGNRNLGEWQHRTSIGGQLCSCLPENSLGNLPFIALLKMHRSIATAYMISIWKKHTPKPTPYEPYSKPLQRTCYQIPPRSPTDLVAHTLSLHRHANAFSLEQLLLTVLHGENVWQYHGAPSGSIIISHDKSWRNEGRLHEAGLPKRSHHRCVFSFGGAWKHVCYITLYQICIQIDGHIIT